MKLTAAALAFAAALSMTGVAQAATTDDVRWVAQCLADNAEATAKVGMDVVSKYCGCMNAKMGDNETRTITEWEKSNPESRKACEAFAGWN
jgi:hypothetical protein